jgi:hypothetical protein
LAAEMDVSFTHNNVKRQDLFEHGYGNIVEALNCFDIKRYAFYTQFLKVCFINFINRLHCRHAPGGIDLSDSVPVRGIQEGSK